ncbi:DUF4892 domain-containing protein [Marinobacter pelagius]|nr:DUF4892 domain-containing protein [Marinobacter sp. C7]MCG7199533.1 DUF4892 domain-containing protein [Marinobacter sp. C7]
MLATLSMEAVASGFPEPFPQSELETSTGIQSGGHLVLFSPVREVNDEIRSETMARLPVSGEGRMYLLNRDASREEARDYYQRLLQARNASVLFECSGVSCGRSVIWANRIFGQAVLNGRDSQQDYLVAGSLAEDGTRWLTLVYTVTRGNLREYVWVEHFSLGDGAVVPGFDTVSDRIFGPLIVPYEGGFTYKFEWEATDRRNLRERAAEEGAVVVLVGFSSLGAEESLDDSLERARGATESLSEVLARIGIPGEQQKILVVGPFIPMENPDRQGDRVEVTVISR